MDWFQISNGICHGCILSPCLFNLYAEYIMQNAGVDAQAGIKIAGRNINNLRYADGTTLMAENKEELKSLFLKVKEESANVGLKLNIQSMKIMVLGPISSVQSLSHVRLFATPWTAAYQAPPSTGFSRQEYWSGVPLPSPVAVTAIE